jgi:RNA polymerase sigma factor (sigma-70 family)
MSTKTTMFIQTLFREQNAGLRRFVASRLSDVNEAEDVAQEAFHNMMRVDEPEKLDNPKAYLYQTAANLALNRIRKQRRQQNYENDLQSDVESGIESSVHSPDDIVAGRQELEQVMATLNSLPDKVSRAFMLSRAENKSYTQISEEMGVSVSSVEKYLITALKHLRKQLPRDS